jgi:hypothetical protein
MKFAPVSEASGVWREDLQTTVRTLAYDFDQRLGVLMLPPDCCTDMSAAIALFTKIDPGVEQILTVAGERRDKTYYRSRDVWKASTAERLERVQ